MNRYFGRIEISPPLTWADYGELSPLLRHSGDPTALVYEEIVTEKSTPEGQLKVRHAVALIPRNDRVTREALLDCLAHQALVLAKLKRTTSGSIVRAGRGERDDLERFEIQGRLVKSIAARLVWEDGGSVAEHLLWR